MFFFLQVNKEVSTNYINAQKIDINA